MHIETNNTVGDTLLIKRPAGAYNYAIRIAVIAALGGVLFGFETAVISGAEKII